MVTPKAQAVPNRVRSAARPANHGQTGRRPARKIPPKTRDLILVCGLPNPDGRRWFTAPELAGGFHVSERSVRLILASPRISDLTEFIKLRQALDEHMATTELLARLARIEQVLGGPLLPESPTTP